MVTQHIAPEPCAPPTGRVRAGSIIAPVFSTDDVPEEILNEHKKIENKIYVQELRKEECATTGAISYIDKMDTSDEFITSDALLYSAKHF